MEGARSMANKQFTLLSAEKEQQFDNPTRCLHHVLDKVVLIVHYHPFKIKQCGECQLALFVSVH